MFDFSVTLMISQIISFSNEKSEKLEPELQPSLISLFSFPEPLFNEK